MYIFAKLLKEHQLLWSRLNKYTANCLVDQTQEFWTQKEIYRTIYKPAPASTHALFFINSKAVFTLL
jgi:hypothetical protein